MDYSLPSFSVHGIFQARILEWVAIPFSRGSSWPRDQTRVSCVSCIGRWILYHWVTWEDTKTSLVLFKFSNFKDEVLQDGSYTGKINQEKKKKEIWRWGFNSWLLLSLVVWIWASFQSFLNLSFLIYKTVCMCVQLFVTPWTVARQTPLSTGSAGKYNGVGCHSLLQGSFLTQGSHPNLLHCRQVLHHWATWEDHIYKTRGC